MIGSIKKWMTGKGERRAEQEAPKAAKVEWESKLIEVVDFDRIEAHGKVWVEWSQGPLSIEATVSLVDSVDVPLSLRVDEGRLIVEMPENSAHPARVKASSKALSGFVCHGAAAGSAMGIEADIFEASLVDGSKLLLAGKAIAARLALKGSGHLDADQLSCHTVMAKASGSGLIDARAESVAEAVVGGGGEVVVRGNPAVSKVEREGDGRAKIGSRVGQVEPENEDGIFGQMPLPKEWVER